MGLNEGHVRRRGEELAAEKVERIRNGASMKATSEDVAKSSWLPRLRRRA